MTTPADVQRIAAGTDPAARNGEITRCYYDLSLAVRGLIPEGANWCTFATWASRQAGQTIRHRDLQNLLRRRLESRIPMLAGGLLTVFSWESRLLMGHVGSVIAELGPIRRSSEQVAEGNLKVFAEIGLLFARFLEVVRDDAGFAAFLGALRAGGPPDGQDLLRRAFQLYREVIPMAAGKAKSERLLLANLLVGLHEQTRLQPQIQGAMDGSLVTLEEVEALLGHRIARIPLLRPLTRRLAEEIKEAARVVITDQMMTLTLPPDRVLRLGRDVPGPFAAELAVIENPELAAVLMDVDPTPDSTAQSGALDWANFGERMHFIADLFREFHFDGALFDPV